MSEFPAFLADPDRRVRLLVDLSRYHPEFMAGVTGRAFKRSGQSDRFFIMVLDHGARLEVLWQGVEVIGDAPGSVNGQASGLSSREPGFDSRPGHSVGQPVSLNGRFENPDGSVDEVSGSLLCPVIERWFPAEPVVKRRRRKGEGAD
jgi:hypothetical protein